MNEYKAFRLKAIKKKFIYNKQTDRLFRTTNLFESLFDNFALSSSHYAEPVQNPLQVTLRWPGFLQLLLKLNFWTCNKLN